MCTGWVEPNSNIVVIGELRSIREKEISVPNRACVCLLFNSNILWYGNSIGHFRNVRGLGKSMVVFRLFEKLKYSNERSTIF